MPKHIVIDARIINSSTGTYVKNLIYQLEKIDKFNKYTILIPTKDRGFYKPKNKNFSIQYADFKNYSLAEQTTFNLFLQQLKADLVHFCMPQQPIFYNGKTVTTFHDLTLLKTYNSDKNWFVFHFKQQIGKLVFKQALQKNNKIITPSNFTKKEILDYFKEIDSQKIVVIHEAADKKPTATKRYNHPFKKFLLYVGQQSDYKNIYNLAAAHQKLLQKYPDLGLILVGKKNKATLKNEELFKKENFQNIIFTDFIDDDQRNFLYKTCTAYVFSSLMEGFGLPALEAMVYKAPVVSSDQTCLPEVYQDGAHYFNPYNIDDMAEKIDEVISSKKLQADLITRSQQILEQYSWQKMAKETLNIYKQILKQ